MRVVIPYKPRNWAKPLHAATVRWIVMVLHRRAGKTTGTLNHLQRDACRTPNSQFAYIGPTYKQVKAIAWEIAKTISDPIPGVRHHESELYVRYPNGSKLFLAGSDNIDSLRGIPLWGAAGDEWPLQNPKLFTEIISKCLADHLGYFIFLGTPKGKNHFYRTLRAALKNPREWLVINKTIDDSLAEETGEVIDNLRQALEDDRKLVKQGLMTQEEFDQEWYCSFDSAVAGAYYAKELAEARRRKRIKGVPHERKLRVFTVTDLGVGRHLATGFYQRLHDETRMIDYWEGDRNDGLPDLAVALQRKPYVYGKHFAPHDVTAAEIGTGKTKLDTAADLGIEFEVVPKVSVDSGIQQGKLMFAHLWIDETNCATWLEHMASYQEKKVGDIGTGKPLKNGSDHAADVHRYAAIVEDEMTNDAYEKARKRERREAEHEPEDDEFGG